nr:hypothetical protein Iba_chr05aCG14870 [Ipomoea batatas]
MYCIAKANSFQVANWRSFAKVFVVGTVNWFLPSKQSWSVFMLCSISVLVERNRGVLLSCTLSGFSRLLLIQATLFRSLAIAANSWLEIGGSSSNSMNSGPSNELLEEPPPQGALQHPWPHCEGIKGSVDALLRKLQISKSGMDGWMRGPCIGIVLEDAQPALEGRSFVRSTTLLIHLRRVLSLVGPAFHVARVPSLQGFILVDVSA